MPSPDGYDTARKLLQENFGKKFQIAKACVDKILIASPLNQHNKPSQIAFSAELTACMCTLSGMNYLHKIDNMDIINVYHHNGILAGYVKLTKFCMN